MKTAKTYAQLMRNEYEDQRSEALKEKTRKKQPPVFTREESDRVIRDMFIALKAQILGETPNVKNEVIRSLFREAIPTMESVPDDERLVRRQVFVLAADAYAHALVDRHAPLYGLDDPKYPADQVDACRCLSEEDRELYARCVARSEPSYYQEHPMSAEAMAEEIYQSQRTISRLMVKAVTAAAETCRDLARGDLSDEELIRKYPRVATSLQLLNHAHSLLKEAKEYRFDDVTPLQLEQADVQADAILANTADWEQRMAIMADPSYPRIKLETMLEATPDRLEQLYRTLTTKKLGAQDSNVDVISGKPISNHPTLSENFAGVAADLTRIRSTSLNRRIAASLGMSCEQMADNMLFMDKNGVTVDIHNVTADQMMKNTGGEFYVVSKFGYRKPLPVMMDRTHGNDTPLIGSKAIARAAEAAAALPAPQAPGVMARMGSWFSERTGGTSTRAMQDYRAAKARHECAQRMSKIGGNQLPAAVTAWYRETTRKNRESEKEKAQLRREVEQGLEYMHHLPEEDTARFDHALGGLLMKKALTENADSMFRCTMFEMLRVMEPGYTRSNAESTLQDSDQFREFAQNLRTREPQLVARLKSGDEWEAHQALNEICERCRLHFTVGSSDRWAKPASLEILQARKEQLKKNGEDTSLLPGQLISKNAAKTMEQDRDNARMWNNIHSIYGASRSLRVDWVASYSTRSVYNMSDWEKIRDNQVDVAALTPEGRPVTERSFTALAMVLALRPSSFYSDASLRMANTLPFEDILATGGGPRDTTGPIFEPIVEPTRKMLKECLEQMHPEQPEEVRSSARDRLAQNLADTLKLYASRMSKASWKNRQDSTLAQVGSQVLQFAREHDMMELLKEKGLTPETLETVKTVCAIGEIANEAFNAEDDLRMDHEGVQKLTAEQRLACIDKMMTFKAIQADIRGHYKEIDISTLLKPANGKEFTNAEAIEYAAKATAALETAVVPCPEATRKYVLGGDPAQLQALSECMLAPEKRRELAEQGAVAIYKKVRCTSDGLDRTWAEVISKNPAAGTDLLPALYEKRDAFAAFESHLTELRRDQDYKLAATAALEVLKSGDPVSKLALVTLSDAQLKRTNQQILNTPAAKFNFTRDLQVYAESKGIGPKAMG